MEEDVAGEQHAAAFIEHRQVGPGVSQQLQQMQPAIADFQHAGLQRFVRQHHLGAAHPVADHPVHVLGHGIALLAQQFGGAGERGDGHAGEGLVAQHMVGMMMGEQHLDDGAIGNFGDGGTHGLAVASGGTAVDHHDTVRGHDEAGIDDVAAVERVEVVRRAFQQPDIFGDLAWLQPVLQLGLCRQGQAQREGQDEQAHVASLA